MAGGKTADDLAVAAARYKLGLQTADTLRAVAVTRLADGWDDDAVVRLAVAEDLNTAELGPLFERVCESYGCPVPDASRAIDGVTGDWLRRLLDGQVTPESALVTLFREIADPLRDEDSAFGAEHVGESHDLGRLVGARWAYDELHNPAEEISFEGLYGGDAITRLDEHVRADAIAWLSASRAAEA